MVMHKLALARLRQVKEQLPTVYWNAKDWHVTSENPTRMQKLRMSVWLTLDNPSHSKLVRIEFNRHDLALSFHCGQAVGLFRTTD